VHDAPNEEPSEEADQRILKIGSEPTTWRRQLKRSSTAQAVITLERHTIIEKTPVV
jgi:hypothetical protein